MASPDYIPLKEYLEIVYNRIRKVKDIYSLTNEERVEYERDLKFARDYNATMKYAQQEGHEVISNASGLSIKEIEDLK